MTLRPTAFVSLALSLFCAGCAHTSGPYELQWMADHPPRLKAMDRTGVYNERLRFEFFDERPEPRELFGVRASTGHEYRTSTAIGSWAASHFKKTLTEYGVPVVESGETVVVRIYVTKVLVTEGGVYRGEFNYRAEAWRPNQPQPFWRGLIQALSRRWGRSASVDMFQGTLTNVVLDAARDLLDDPGFLNSLRMPPAYQMVPIPVAPVPVPPPTPATVPAQPR
ncbi:MAG: hypothetical protein QM765_36190 [Myxococcales bacterium]